ncbi:tRNA pseudouridine synthase B [Aliidongia dinghuensis]|uniref:tRNA pseudouridine synthase B n=1 Tax=Aliidongia dinghuensis TaxID=1867774 RepID=A0A8J2YPA4_9PROT|nr:tRNA pseudouridine(55) synthase TruB [Aliidongia dinghuensis]GGE99591.1 tRNA pseudouridine synthase B [Aliidongia dinghuensis]
MKRRGLPVHGWVAFDKPVGMTSTQAVGRVRRAFNAEKAGHGGTLDPLASGMLPIALGEATKTVAYAMAGTKRYRLTVRWGEATATDDAEGAVIETSAVRPTESQIRAALRQFTGDIQQVPSTYSAILIDGVRAYDLARAGETVELQPRAIRIDAFELVERPDEDHATFEVTCGKGAYMRSLGRDLAKVLGTFGHLVALRRLSVGRFTVDHAISVDMLDQLGHIRALSEHLLPIETALDDIPALALTEAEALRLRHGQCVPPPCPPDRANIDQLGNGSIVSVSASGKLVALAALDEGMLRPVRVLNL